MPDLYIGKTFDPATSALGDRFLVDPADFTTHGIVIGMTGSGKTGLSACIIEEALKAKRDGKKTTILFNLCGHGNYDMQAYMDFAAGKLRDEDYSQQELAMALAGLPKVAVPA